VPSSYIVHGIRGDIAEMIRPQKTRGRASEESVLDDFVPTHMNGDDENKREV